MTDQIVYIVVDVEVDGPIPGCHSMLNLSAVATDHTGNGIGTFSVNIMPPLGTSPRSRHAFMVERSQRHYLGADHEEFVALEGRD